MTPDALFWELALELQAADPGISHMNALAVECTSVQGVAGELGSSPFLCLVGAVEGSFTPAEGGGRGVGQVEAEV